MIIVIARLLVSKNGGFGTGLGQKYPTQSQSRKSKKSQIQSRKFQKNPDPSPKNPKNPKKLGFIEECEKRKR